MNKSILATQQGTGLLETLLIVLFVSIGVVAIMNFQHNLSYSTNTTQQQLDATILASSEIETLRDFQVLSTTAGYTAYSGIASGSTSSTVGNTTYTITWTVTTYTSPTYKNISVAVTWTDRFSNPQSITLTTQVAGIDPATAASVV